MTSGLLLVCVMADGQALQLVKQGRQLQLARDGPWRVLHLDTVSARYASSAVKQDLEEALQLARSEGAQVVHSSLNMNATAHLMSQIVHHSQGGAVSDVLLGDQATGTVYWPGFGERLSDFTEVLGTSVPNAQVHTHRSGCTQCNGESPTGLASAKWPRPAE